MNPAIFALGATLTCMICLLGTLTDGCSNVNYYDQKLGRYATVQDCPSGQNMYYSRSSFNPCNGGAGDACCEEKDMNHCSVHGCKFFCYLDSNGDGELDWAEVEKADTFLKGYAINGGANFKQDFTDFSRKVVGLCPQEVDKLLGLVSLQDANKFPTAKNLWDDCLKETSRTDKCPMVGFAKPWMQICALFTVDTCNPCSAS